MAVTRRPNVIQHTAAADISTGRLMIMQLIWNGSTIQGNVLACKNSAGTILNMFKSDGSGFQSIAWPFGRIFVDGLETDVLNGGTVEYILA